MLVPERRSLVQVLATLAELGVIPRIAALLESGAEQAGRALREAVLAEVPAFSASGNPEIVPALDRHGSEHVAEICRLFGGGEIGDFEFIAAQARLRAEQRFPLEAFLHAYRCGHRVCARWLRDAAIAVSPANAERAISAVADFAIEYTNIISTIATAKYVAHTRMLAEAESDQRSELLNILLSGYDESDARVARLLKRAGYLEQRQSYSVVVAQPVNATEMENPARAQRFVTAIAEAVSGTPIRTLAGVRGNFATAILSDKRRHSGWTTPQAALAERIGPLLLALGPSVLVGISADHPSTSFLPRALQEAAIALDFAGVANRVVQFSGLPIRDLLVHRGGDYVQSTPPGWVQSFIEADAGAAGTLIQTLRAVADADMNTQRAARSLGKHPNTIYARMERIKAITGRDGQRFHDLNELLLAADCWRS